jgi:hypothetical protein
MSGQTDDARLAQSIAMLADAQSRTVQLIARSRSGARALVTTTVEDEAAEITALCEQAKQTALGVDHGKLKEN